MTDFPVVPDEDAPPEVPWLTRDEIIARDRAEIRAAGYWHPVEVEWDDGEREVWRFQIFRSSGDPEKDFAAAEAKARKSFFRILDELVAIRPAPDPDAPPPPKPWEEAGISRAAWYRRQKAAKAAKAAKG